MRLLEALRRAAERPGQVVIPDIKCRSPGEGELMRGRDPVEMAVRLAGAGAPALSVVTERSHFGGSLELLRRIVRATGLPVLCKDFFSTPDELKAAREAGAAAILLIYACLGEERLAALSRSAEAIGLEVLVEAHTAEELAMASRLGAPLVGLNNRDILQLERDGGGAAHIQALGLHRPREAFLISESGLRSPMEIRQAIRAGADAALVGTALWQTDGPIGTYRRFCRRCSIKLCGITERVGLEHCRAAGADLLGFVVDYPEPVPWNLTVTEAERLLPHCGEIPSCVVTGGRPEQVVALARRLHPRWIQLHHRETLAETAWIAREAAALGIGVIRSIPVDRTVCAHQFGTADPETLARRLAEVGVGMLLIDTRGASGQREQPLEAAMALYRTLHRQNRLPVLLGGGIHKDNLEEILRQSGADFIDVLSGSEDAPGEKSKDKIRDLLERIGG